MRPLRDPWTGRSWASERVSVSVVAGAGAGAGAGLCWVGESVQVVVVRHRTSPLPLALPSPPRADLGRADTLPRSGNNFRVDNVALPLPGEG